MKIMKNIFVICLTIIFNSIVFAESYIVINTNDSGPGSLRQAMFEANNHTGPDTILFNIPLTDINYNSLLGVWTIQPDSSLPVLDSDSTFIDGTSQSNFIGSETNIEGPEIEIDGTNAGEVNGLTILGASNVIKNLVINRFEKFGIEISYDLARANVICGNYIGTDAQGMMDLGNGFSGVILYNGSKHNLIGGTIPADRNICSGNGWAGIEIQGDRADSNLVIGNFVGSNKLGTEAIPNDKYGVYIWSYAKANVVGGQTPEERNLISGNQWGGVDLGKSDKNSVLGNFIGTNIYGDTAIPNGHSGITISGNQNSIGGLEPGESNLISGNGHSGISISGDDNIVSGNYIGTDVTGQYSIPNDDHGIFIHYGAKNNKIGPQNTIKFNIEDGVKIEADSTTGNTITQNSISQNTELGIHTSNGGNIELTPPTIDSITVAGIYGQTILNGIVEIYSDSNEEGEIFEATVNADVIGNFFWAGNPQGPNLTATVTDAEGNTSEFSLPFQIPTAIHMLEDSLALVALYDSTNGDSWTNNTNWLTSQPVSNWFGITVTNERVTQIRLDLNNLVGTIPPSFDNLTALTYLNFERNEISGPFPQELLSLTNLTDLSIRNNQFTGAIPAYIDTLLNLTRLHLYNNPLTGHLPSELGNLLNLTNMRISGTQIDGPIPPELGNLINLTNLGLRQNQLSGEIPPELGNLTKLDNLELYGNQLTGEIPKELGNLVNLRRLFLQVNQLTGPIPVELGNLTLLDNFQLDTNQLTGTIPTEFKNLVNLTILFLSGNHLSGSVPNEIIDLTKLERFYINHNELESLPDLSDLVNISELHVQNNKFTFKDIEKNVGFAASFTYSPQDSIGVEQDTIITIGSSLTLTTSAGGESTKYQWMKDGVVIPTATDSSYTIDSAELTDSGSYVCEVTNTIATDLTLFSRPITVLVENPVSISDNNSQLPEVFALYQNYPNPFNPETEIKYQIAKSGLVDLSVYNVLGQKIKTLINDSIEPGYYSIKWDGTDEFGTRQGSGVYIVRFDAKQFSNFRKMLLLQ